MKIVYWCIAKLNDMTTKKKLLGSYVLLVFIPVLVVGLILTTGMRNMALLQSVNEASTNVDRLEKNISDIIKVPTNFSDTLFLDNTLKTIVSTKFSATIDVVQAYWQYTKFDDYLRLYNYMDGIMFYSGNNTIIENWRFMKATDAIKRSTWYKDAVARKGLISWNYIYNKAKNKYTLCMTRMVGTSGNPLGVLVIDINSNYLNSLLRKEPFDTVIIDDKGIIATAKDASLIGLPVHKLGLNSSIIGEDKGIYQTNFENKISKVIIKSFYPQGSLTKLKIICAFPIDSITRVADKTSLLGFTIIAVSLMILLVFITLFSNVLSKRIKRLSDNVHKVALGDFDLSPPIRGKDEVGQLSNDIDMMARSIQKLMNEVYEASIQKNSLIIKQKEIKLKMLANQINPHFLFNALETIRMKISNIGEVETADVVALLGKIMRRNLEAGSELTTVAEEMDIVRSYLDIQKFRYGDKINYELKITEDINRYNILPLTIQPIVENAVIHGLENISQAGTVIVQSSRENGNIIISVIDNGFGMDAKRLDFIRASLNDGESESDKRIGLKNVHQRIKLQFGEDYGLVITSELGKGTRVDILLPGIG